MRDRLAVIGVISLLLLLYVSFSQDEAVTNLLSNGDFEGDFVELDGADPRNVAESWTPWHVAATDTSPSFANHDPNYDEETDRIRLDEAGKAQQYFTLFATHRGGIYQEVDSLTSGTTYRFSIYAHVWSSSFEDVDLSEDPGDVVLRVGIDPDGGTDGTSDDIIWSTAATFFYDAYRQYAVIATAESSTITVFVESTVGEPRANNYIYLDDAVLEVASETVVVVDSTPTSETNDNLVDETTPTATMTATQTATATATATATVTATATQTATATDDKSAGSAGKDDTETRGEEQPPPPDATDTPTVTATSTPTATATATMTATAEPTDTAEPTATATVADDEDDEDDPVPISDEFSDTEVHVVVDGDTVSALAVQYESTVDAINRANGLNAANLIFVGQRLIIPVNLPEPPEDDAPSNTPTATPTATPTTTATSTLTPTLTPTITPSPTATPVTYQIQPGDTLETIANRHGTTVELLAQQNNIANMHQIDVGVILVIPTPIPAPTAIPTPTPVPTATPVPSTSGSYVIYVVQAGDALGEIASEYNTTVAAIAQLNGITNPSRIFPGQELKIPSADGSASIVPESTSTAVPTPTPLPTNVPITYTVQPGDTLYGIAGRFGVSAVELAQLNNISNYNQLSVGQVLTIPG